MSYEWSRTEISGYGSLSHVQGGLRSINAHAQGREQARGGGGSVALITLQRQAPVAPGVSACRFCGANIDATVQDHLLLGQPGTQPKLVAICPACGSVLYRLIETCGPNLSFVVQRGPSARLDSGSL
jgi:hypothetical protein